MQIDQSFTLPAPPAQAWPAFKDIALLVECLPGAALTGPAVDGEWPLRFDIKLGPIAAGFIGAGRVSADDAAQQGRFEGTAADKRTNSRVKGAAVFSVEPAGEGSRVTVSVDYTLTGALAQFSRGGIVRELATALTAQFAANLASRLVIAAGAEGAKGAKGAEVAEVAPEAGSAPSAPPPSPPTPAVAPLGAGALLLQVLKARWQRFADRWLRRRPA